MSDNPRYIKIKWGHEPIEYVGYAACEIPLKEYRTATANINNITVHLPIDDDGRINLSREISKALAKYSPDDSVVEVAS